ncbi:MAG: hypothetical protein ACKPJJ_31610 [Planctomycetaceae bacterium]
MVGQQDGDAGVSQPSNDVLDFMNGDGVDPGEGFIEQDDGGVTGECASNFESSSFAAGE